MNANAFIKRFECICNHPKQCVEAEFWRCPLVPGKSENDQTLGYGRVEDVLARVFGADERTRPTLRARINGLQRNGLTYGSPGRGKVVRYSVRDIYEWGLALSFAEFGLASRLIVRVIEGGLARAILLELEKHASGSDPSHLFLIYYPSLFYDQVADDDPMFYVTVPASRLRVSDLWGGGYERGDLRFGLIDLTGLIRRIDTALSQTQT